MPHLLDLFSNKTQSNRFATTHNFHISGLTIATVIKKISDEFSIQALSNTNLTYTLWDSFDWRLLRANLFLLQSDQQCVLGDTIDFTPINSIDETQLKGATFQKEIKDPALNKKLKNYLSCRALLGQVEYKESCRRISLLNDDRKTIAYLDISDIHAKSLRIQKSKALKSLSIRLSPFRGYENECSKILKWLESFSFHFQALSFNQWMQKTVPQEVIGEQKYTNRLRLKLEPSQPANLALIEIFKQCTDTMLLNVSGIIKDEDTEFLHDFRVASRRIRSGLTFAKTLFDAQSLHRAKMDIKQLGIRTNAMRDIDVYLLAEDKMKLEIPQEMRQNLNPFFDDLRKSRTIEQKKLARFLQGTSYKGILKRWQNFLDLHAPTDNPASVENVKSIHSVAHKQIIKALDKLIRNGSAISQESPDAQVHDLRIDCKKLRYLMEFYSSLFPKESIERFISALKKLQNCLGKFNDCSVQQVSLRLYLDELNRKSQNLKLAAAIGVLIGKLHNDQLLFREQFFVRFEEFTASQNSLLTNQLFNYSPSIQK